MISDSRAATCLNEIMIEVRDIVLTELQDLSVKDIKQSDARNALKQRLISAISQILPKKTELEDLEPIRKVLFEELVIQ